MTFYFEIQEARDGAWVRLRLTGELDLGSAPVLRARLEALRAQRQSVRLDLSSLEFMDSSGIHLLISAFNDARADGWQFEVEPRLSRQVARSLELAHVDRIVAEQHQNGDQLQHTATAGHNRGNAI